jgi:putative FmdB family regulatory protein
MPLYEYRCQSCGRTREVLQKMSDPPLKVCADCGGEMKRMVSAPAVQFKGTGWYVTDYAKKSDGGRSGGSSDKDKGSSEKSASSGEGGSSSSSDSAGTAEKIPAADKPAASSSPAPAKEG